MIDGCTRPAGSALRGQPHSSVAAFLAAERDGNFAALLAALDPDVVLRADQVAVHASVAAQGAGAPQLVPEMRGAAAVATTFTGRARATQPALVNGAAGAVWSPNGTPQVVFGFTIARGKIVAIDILADPTRLRQLALTILDD